MLVNFRELAERTILSQYSTSKHIKGLIYAFQEAIDPTAEIQQFYDDIFNFETAKDYGLDIWGVIVATTRYLDVERGKFFGYYTSENSSRYDPETYKSFYTYDQQPFFYNRGTTTYFKLSTASWRMVLKTKMFINISDSTLPSLKQFVRMIFTKTDGTEDIRNTVINNGTMAVRFLIYNSTEDRVAILKQYAQFATGAGISTSYGIVPESYFGFAGTDAVPFGQAEFSDIFFYNF